MQKRGTLMDTKVIKNLPKPIPHPGQPLPKEILESQLDTLTKRVIFLAHALKRSYTHRTGWQNLTPMQQQVLHFLFLHAVQGQEVYQRDMEQHFGIRRSTATGILQLMEKRNLIKRERTATDGRLKPIVLTEDTLALQEELAEHGETLDAILLADIPDEELRTCGRVLQKMIANLREEESGQ